MDYTLRSRKVATQECEIATRGSPGEPLIGIVYLFFQGERDESSSEK
jgi:hypothetical protein